MRIDHTIVYTRIRGKHYIIHARPAPLKGQLYTSKSCILVPNMY